MTAAVSLNSWAASKTGPLAPPKKPSTTRIAAMSSLSDWWCWYRWWSQEEPLRPDPALKQKGKSCCSCKNIAFCANTACSTHHIFCRFCIFCTLHYSALQSTSCLVCIIQHWKAMLSCSASKLSLGNFMISFYVCIPSVSTVFIHFDQFLFFLPTSLNFLPHDAELALQKSSGFILAT